MKQHKRLLACIGITMALTVGTASAACYEPSSYNSAPSSFYERRPSVPYCLSQYSYSREHTCQQYELDSYFDDVQDYVDALNEHHAELVEFANAAVKDANDYLIYVECEVDEVVAQHE